MRPRSWELRTQTLNSCLFRTHSVKVLPLKPGVGKYIATRAILTAWDFCLANFYSSGPFTCIFSKNLSRVFHVLATPNTGKNSGEVLEKMQVNGPEE